MKKLLIAVMFLGLSACSSEDSASTLSSASLVGEWQYAGIYGSEPDTRIPSFLADNGYILKEDGSFEARTKPDYAEKPVGTYSISGDQLTMESRSFINKPHTSQVKIENGYLILLADPTIRDEHDKPAQTRYRKVN